MRTLVVVSGPVASGKSSLAAPLAERLGLALVAKDTIKEALFDALGPGDTDWSSQLGAAAYAVMWSLGPGLAQAVLEANFGAGDVAHLRELSPRPIQIHCTAPADRLEQRFGERDRHPGHVDDRYPTGRDDQAEPLDLGGPVRVVDTSAVVDLDDIVAWVRGEIG